MAQNFENHAKIVPAFHYFILPVLAINFVQSIFQVVHHFSVDGISLSRLSLTTEFRSNEAWPSQTPGDLLLVTHGFGRY